MQLWKQAKTTNDTRETNKQKASLWRAEMSRGISAVRRHRRRFSSQHLPWVWRWHIINSCGAQFSFRGGAASSQPEKSSNRSHPGVSWPRVLQEIRKIPVLLVGKLSAQLTDGEAAVRRRGASRSLQKAERLVSFCSLRNQTVSPEAIFFLQCGSCCSVSWFHEVKIRDLMREFTFWIPTFWFQCVRWASIRGKMTMKLWTELSITEFDRVESFFILHDFQKTRFSHLRLQAVR